MTLSTAAKKIDERERRIDTETASKRDEPKLSPILEESASIQDEEAIRAHAALRTIRAHAALTARRTHHAAMLAYGSLVNE